MGGGNASFSQALQISQVSDTVRNAPSEPHAVQGSMILGEKIDYLFHALEDLQARVAPYQGLEGGEVLGQLHANTHFIGIILCQFRF